MRFWIRLTRFVVNANRSTTCVMVASKGERFSGNVCSSGRTGRTVGRTDLEFQSGMTNSLAPTLVRALATAWRRFMAASLGVVAFPGKDPVWSGRNSGSGERFVDVIQGGYAQSRNRCVSDWHCGSGGAFRRSRRNGSVPAWPCWGSLYRGPVPSGSGGVELPPFGCVPFVRRE